MLKDNTISMQSYFSRNNSISMVDFEVQMRNKK